MGCVPQEPVLISGLTIAENLDPAGEEPPEALERAIEECSLTAVVGALPQGIHTPVGEGGADRLTAGQRQLLCFARVLVRRPPVVLLDEATASLDPASDAAVLRAILAASRSSTIINIAHRLQTSEGGGEERRVRGGDEASPRPPPHTHCSHAGGPRGRL